MEIDLFKEVAQQGPYAMLFIGLLIYIMRENAKRETVLMSFTKEITAAVQEMAVSLKGLTDSVTVNTDVIVSARDAIKDCEKNHVNRTRRVPHA